MLNKNITPAQQEILDEYNEIKKRIKRKPLATDFADSEKKFPTIYRKLESLRRKGAIPS